MRLGSQKMRFRALLAGVSLAGLGIAASLPMLAGSMVGQQVDPIMTQSVDKTATGEPTSTDMPPALPADDEFLDDELAERDATARDMAEDDAPLRQIIPQSSEAATPTSPSDMATTATSPAGTLPAQTAMAAPAATFDPASAHTTTLAGDGTAANSITLALDHARVLRLVGDVSTIILGNPAIADASMPDPGTLILTGKSYGETNMVMLDVDGNILAERMLSVTVRGQNLVSVYRGVQRTTFSCAPTCEIRPTPGDTPETVQAGLNAFQARNDAALQAVNGAQ